MTPENANFIRGMERAGKFAAETLLYAAQLVKVGVTTDEIDRAVLEYTESRGAKSACLGYHGYPKAICTSVNDIICHGVPDSTILKDGDIINVDVTTVLNGYFGDTSATYLIGNVSEKARAITLAAEQARDRGIEAITPNGTTGDIGAEINKLVTRKGYHVVREIGGHGIGTKFHDEPFVPSFGKRGKGERLKPFHCITVEPMINETDADFDEFDIPGSTIKWYRTADRSLSAQFEHTVLITDTGYQILTIA
jgi:methionyl aminopeptidase